MVTNGVSHTFSVILKGKAFGTVIAKKKANSEGYKGQRTKVQDQEGTSMGGLAATQLAAF
jgi:hypothetical protein